MSPVQLLFDWPQVSSTFSGANNVLISDAVEHLIGVAVFLHKCLIHEAEMNRADNARFINSFVLLWLVEVGYLMVGADDWDSFFLLRDSPEVSSHGSDPTLISLH